MDQPDYALILHSLQHEHTSSYVDRHALILEKWPRDFKDGLYLKDLESIVQVMAILHERYVSYPQQFRRACMDTLVMCSKPLLESKASERKKEETLKNLRAFYLIIGRFFIYEDIDLKSTAAQTLRCMLNPALINGYSEGIIMAALKVPVIDRELVQRIVRESRTLGAIVEAFHVAANACMTTNIFANFKAVAVGYPKLKAAVNGSADSDDEDVVNRDFKREETPEENNSSAVSAEVPASVKYAYILLDLCRELAIDSLNAALMCHMKVCDSVVKLIRIGLHSSFYGRKEDKIPIAVDLMWTVIELYVNKMRGEMEASLEIVSYEVAVDVLLELLLNFLREGKSLVDKERRNEVAIVLALLAKFPASIPYLSRPHVLCSLITYSCYAEAGKPAWPFFSRTVANIRNFGLPIDADLQLKHTLWVILTEVLKYNDTDAVLMVASSPLLSVLLIYVAQDSSDGAVRTEVTGLSQISRFTYSATRGGETFATMKVKVADLQATLNSTKPSLMSLFSKLSRQHLRECQVAAMKFLAFNASKMMGEFLRIQGVNSVVDVAVRYCSSRVSEHRDLVFHALQVISKCLTTSMDLVKDCLVSRNVLRDPLLFLFDKAEEEHIRSLAARVIALLCAGGDEIFQTQFRIEQGARVAMRAVDKYMNNKKPLVGRKSAVIPERKKAVGNDMKDPDEDDRDGDVSILIVSVIECIDKSIVRNSKNELAFADEEGVDKLLELLEVSPFALRAAVLRLLSELLENNLLKPFAKTWRSSRTMRTAVQLLCHCYLDEEIRIDCVREDGVIHDLFNPLGNHKWAEIIIPEVDKDPRESRLNFSMFGSGFSSPSMSVSSSFFDAKMGEMESVMTRPLLVTRLATAIMEGRYVAKGIVPYEVRSDVLGNDMRAVIASILQAIDAFADESIEVISYKADGAAIDADGPAALAEELPIVRSLACELNLAERQVLAVARRYENLRAGEAWRDVLTGLQKDSVDVFEGDLIYIENQLEIAFRSALAVKAEQMELLEQEKKKQLAQEKIYNDDMVLINSQLMQTQVDNSKTKMPTGGRNNIAFATIKH